MSYNDYLDGLRDGFNIGFKVGVRKGFELGHSSGYLSGYKDGYKDSSLGLPYKPKVRLNEFKLNMPKIVPLPKYELELPNYEPPDRKFDLLPEHEFKPLLPKYEPLKSDLFDNSNAKKPWEMGIREYCI